LKSLGEAADPVALRGLGGTVAELAGICVQVEQFRPVAVV
jgi:hypothetical protein